MLVLQKYFVTISYVVTYYVYLKFDSIYCLFNI